MESKNKILIALVTFFLATTCALLGAIFGMMLSPKPTRSRMAENQSVVNHLTSKAPDLESVLTKAHIHIYKKKKLNLGNMTEYTTSRGEFFYDPISGQMMFGVLIDLKNKSLLSEVTYARLLHNINGQPVNSKEANNALPVQNNTEKPLNFAYYIHHFGVVSDGFSHISPIIRKVANDSAKVKVLAKTKPSSIALTRAKQALSQDVLEFHKEIFSKIPDEDAITFPAQVNQVGTINVIGHASCPHCQDFVTDNTAALQKLGFKVRYFFGPYPDFNQDQSGRVYLTETSLNEAANSHDALNMASVYCSPHPQKTFLQFIKTGMLNNAITPSAACIEKEKGIIAFNYPVNHVNATPAIIDSKGVLRKGAGPNFIHELKVEYGLHG